MTTTATAYPDQLTLPGQAAAPGGPVDMTMMYLMHHAFRRDLRRFDEAVAATPVDDRSTWQALAERWDRFFVILHHHHTGEDAGIWPFLLDRADAEERGHLEAMEEEHSHIDPLLTSVATGFEALGRGALPRNPETVRAALHARIEDTREALGRHLAHEETDAMAILQRHMTPTDWERIEQVHFKADEHPVALSFMVPWLAEGVPTAGLDEVFSGRGQAFRVLWWLTRGGYRRSEQRAFRYAS
ncbi:hemerythrin domain-containing protein [Nocardioides sp. CER19]|uniref:hemerythrin domain-containing protein n=1 Tax=Nocardioides sp. CER19 TaxID=3038538 RepID=UPI00244BF56D|nr:hemerythrin domain-containing protein [Nocardioides sp. CER19]MDH2413458.1 hemerythrin domain-containing protein [Nocardioides sp. CER19]